MKRSNSSKPHSAKFMRQRKFFLFLPVMVIPSVTVLFYLLGGGTANNVHAESVSSRGLNTSLPNANIKKDIAWNKLQYYEQADKDSLKKNELIRNDPNYHEGSVESESSKLFNSDTSLLSFSKAARSKNTFPNSSGKYRDPNEQRVYTKLAELDKALKTPDAGATESTTGNKNNYHPDSYSKRKENSDEISRLEKMMKLSQSKDQGDDPEMTDINGMLEKIMDVQHPERVKEKIQQESIKHKRRVFTVSTVSNENAVSMLESKANSKAAIYPDPSDSINHLAKSKNAFYSMDDPIISAEENNAVTAVAEETQTVVNGSVVKLRLGQDVYIQGLFIPKNTFAYGRAQLDEERLTISINSIRFDNSILPVSLSVYDLDGIEGIYVPGAITKEAIKNSADQSMQSFGIATVDPSLKAKAATAGIEAAKSLLIKKTKLVRVTIKAGYQVLLKDKNEPQN